jgi:subtilisin family serine protease
MSSDFLSKALDWVDLGIDHIDFKSPIEGPKNWAKYEPLIKKGATYFEAHKEENAFFAKNYLRYLHGTHVAALAVEDLPPSKVRLIPSPIVTSNDIEILGVASSEKKKRNMEVINRAISEQEIRVVNMSLGSEGFFSDGVKETMTDVLPLLTANPDTVFVFAVGNSGKDLSKHAELLTSLGVKNCVFVAGLNESDGVASSYGAGFVHLAARGVQVESARTGGGTMRLSGASFAAPQVTRKIAQIRYEHPELKAPEVIQYLLDRETLKSESLVGKITDGRVLKPNLEGVVHMLTQANDKVKLAPPNQCLNSK